MLHSVNVDHEHEVFAFWIEGKTGITIKMTSEEAIRIGEIGEMARIRKMVEEMEDDDSRSVDG